MTCGSYPLSWGAESLLTLHKPFFFSVKDVSLLFLMQILPRLMFLFILVYSSFVILVLWLLLLFGCLDANSELLCNPSASLFNLFEYFVIL